MLAKALILVAALGGDAPPASAAPIAQAEAEIQLIHGYHGHGHRRGHGSYGGRPRGWGGYGRGYRQGWRDGRRHDRGWGRGHGWGRGGGVYINPPGPRGGWGFGVIIRPGPRHYDRDHRGHRDRDAGGGRGGRDGR